MLLCTDTIISSNVYSGNSLQERKWNLLSSMISFQTIYAMMNPQSTSALNESSKNSTESVKVMELSEAAKVKKIIKFKTHSRKKGKMVKE